MIERMKDIYLECLNKFNSIKDYDVRCSLEDIILDFEHYIGMDNLYIFMMLYSDKNYEEWCARNTMDVNVNYRNFLGANQKNIMKALINFAYLDEKEEGCVKTYVPNIETIINNFFLQVDKDLYDLFNSMNNKNNIFRVQTDGNGKAYYDPDKKEHYVTIGKSYSFENMAALVHEMGHVYHDYLVKHRYIHRDLDEHLKSEIFSETLEILFVKYLIDNDIYSIEATNYLNILNNKIIRVSRELCMKGLVYSLDSGSNIRDITYSFGKMIGYSFIDSNMSLKEFFMYVENNKFMDLINNIDYQSICENIKKSYCLKKQ